MKNAMINERNKFNSGNFKLINADENLYFKVIIDAPVNRKSISQE